MNTIASMYYDGEGVQQDFSEAKKFFLKAVELGSEKAMLNLGIMYYNGEGVQKDYTEAVRWLRKAAELGDASAIGILQSIGE